MLASHGDSVTLPVCWLYCTRLYSLSSFKIFSSCSARISSFFASCLILWVSFSSIADKMSVVLSIVLSCLVNF